MQPAVQEFLESIAGTAVPTHSSLLVQSVWNGLKGDWTKAHEIAQGQSGADAAWVHAWLHRVEGDQVNARYWYREAKCEPRTGDTRTEGEAIAATLLAR